MSPFICQAGGLRRGLSIVLCTLKESISSVSSQAFIRRETPLSRSFGCVTLEYRVQRNTWSCQALSADSFLTHGPFQAGFLCCIFQLHAPFCWSLLLLMDPVFPRLLEMWPGRASLTRICGWKRKMGTFFSSDVPPFRDSATWRMCLLA